MTYIKRKSQKQEARTAKEFAEVRKQSQVQIASGAIAGLKGDARTGERTSGFNEDDFLIENKFTDADKYKLDISTWEKISKEALHDNLRTPLMQVDIQDISLVIMSNVYFRFMGGLHYWTVKDLLEVKGKSTQLKLPYYQEQLEMWERMCTKIHFLKTNEKLIVVEKDDFLRFLTQNIEN